MADINRNARPTSSESAWQQTTSQVLTHSIKALWAAYGTVSLDALDSFVLSRPTSDEEEKNAEWRASSFWNRTFELAVMQPARMLHTDRQRHEADIRKSYDYWTKVVMKGNSRTVGDIIQTVSAKLHPLSSGPIHDLFTTTTSWVPEMTHEGAITVVNLPTDVWHEAGGLAQHIIKFCWQRATGGRDVHATTRPVFLFADECQDFLSDYDAAYQSKARSKRAATVYLTQSLPMFYSRIGGRTPKEAAQALLGNFTTKIFHANSDAETNNYASDLIGRSTQWRQNMNAGDNYGLQEGESWNSGSSSSAEGTSHNSGGGGSSSRSEGSSRGIGATETMEKTVEPNAFTSLRKGGKSNGYIAEAIVYQGGRRFMHNGQATWLPVRFPQGY